MLGKTSLPSKCSHCEEPFYEGFARCPSCRALRKEFEEFAELVRPEYRACIFSGAETDVVLPCGDAVWAPYLFDLIEARWVDEGLCYTEEFFRQRPHLRGDA